MVTSSNKPNLEEIRHGVFLCRTQAGFRKLMKWTFGCENSREGVFKGISTYPEKYPAIVIPDRVRYFECGVSLTYIVYPDDFNAISP